MAKISARTVTVSIETIRVSIVQPVTSCYARTCVHCTRFIAREQATQTRPCEKVVTGNMYTRVLRVHAEKLKIKKYTNEKGGDEEWKSEMGKVVCRYVRK